MILRHLIEVTMLIPERLFFSFTITPIPQFNERAIIAPTIFESSGGPDQINVLSAEKMALF
jgi:hypothetical protein